MKMGKKSALGKAFFATVIMVFSFGLLPGCMLLGPALSLGSLGSGVVSLQYAAVAYNVGEYSYEYAAHDKTPDEVIQAKIDGILSGDAFELPGFSDEVETQTALAEADVDESTVYDKATVFDAPTMAAATPTTTPAPALSDQARQQRIAKLLDRRRLQYDRMELRRMAFLKAKNTGELSLRQKQFIGSPDLFHAAVDEVRLR